MFLKTIQTFCWRSRSSNFFQSSFCHSPSAFEDGVLKFNLFAASTRDGVIPRVTLNWFPTNRVITFFFYSRFCFKTNIATNTANNEPMMFAIAENFARWSFKVPLSALLNKYIEKNSPTKTSGSRMLSRIFVIVKSTAPQPKTQLISASPIPRQIYRVRPPIKNSNRQCNSKWELDLESHPRWLDLQKELALTSKPHLQRS